MAEQPSGVRPAPILRGYPGQVDMSRIAQLEVDLTDLKQLVDRLSDRVRELELAS